MTKHYHELRFPSPSSLHVSRLHLQHFLRTLDRVMSQVLYLPAAATFLSEVPRAKESKPTRVPSVDVEIEVPGAGH